MAPTSTDRTTGTHIPILRCPATPSRYPSLCGIPPNPGKRISPDDTNHSSRCFEFTLLSSVFCTPPLAANTTLQFRFRRSRRYDCRFDLLRNARRSAFTFLPLCRTLSPHCLSRRRPQQSRSLVCQQRAACRGYFWQQFENPRHPLLKHVHPSPVIFSSSSSSSSRHLFSVTNSTGAYLKNVSLNPGGFAFCSASERGRKTESASPSRPSLNSSPLRSAASIRVKA